MSNPCKDILQESGFSSLQADHILDQLRNSKKGLNDLTEDLLRKTEKDDFIPWSDGRSFEVGSSYMDALIAVGSKVQKPFKTLMEFFGGDGLGLTQKAQSRWHGLLSRLTAETGVDSRTFFKLIEGEVFDDSLTPFQKSFVQEMFHDGEEMLSGNKEAFKLALALKKNYRLDIEEANLYGAGIKFKNHWVTNQYHNSEQLLKYGPEKWINKILQSIDLEETILNIKYHYPDSFGKIADEKFDIHKFLSGAYDSIIGATENGSGVLIEQFKLHRIFEFESPEKLIEYNSQFGHKNLAHAIFENIQMFQKYLTIGESMGYGRVTIKPNKNWSPGQPKELKEVFNPLLETKKYLLSLKEMNKISSNQYSQLSAILREISGDDMIAGSARRAAMVQNWVAWQSMAVLGKSMFATVSDVGSAAIMLHHQGLGPGQAYYGMIRHVLRQMTDQLPEAEKRLVYQALHTATDGTLMSNSSRIATDMKTAGLLARGANEMFHFSGLNAVTNAMRNGYSYMSSNILANNLSKNWDDLLPRYRADFLEKYNITKGDWENLQAIGSFNAKIWNKNANKLENYITMDHILERGQELKISGTVQLARKIDNYFIQEARSAVPEAKARDRAILFGNHDRGSWPDVARRLATVFRSYQSQLVRNLYPRIYKIGLPSVVHVVPYVGLGYTAITLKELVKGKEPPPFDDPELWVDAVVHSGLAPIVGDFIAGEYGRYDHDWDESIGGFSYSKFTGFKDLVVGLWEGNKDASDVWKSVRYNTPFANLYFTEAAVNYGLHYAMMESLKPNYLYALEAQASSQGTDFFFEPSNLYGG